LKPEKASRLITDVNDDHDHHRRMKIIYSDPKLNSALSNTGLYVSD